ncbi:MAG: DUF2892 domain-containing protein [Proteobacteria bacterium]|nr:DUF2892 domain-containing protein [Pseudomonadota bacterium]
MSELNVGNLDRLLRIALGITLIALTLAGLIGPWGWIGAIPLVTGIVARCPVYALFGWRTSHR